MQRQGLFGVQVLTQHCRGKAVGGTHVRRTQGRAPFSGALPKPSACLLRLSQMLCSRAIILPRQFAICAFGVLPTMSNSLIKLSCSSWKKQARD